MRESVSMATWKKAILEPSPSRGSLVQVVKGTCCGHLRKSTLDTDP